MYKKLLDIAYATISLLALLAFGSVVAHAQESHTQSAFPIYIPLVFKEVPTTYSIQGKVVNQQNAALAGVTVRTNTGLQVVTDQSGNYIFSGLPAGSYTITPSQSGMSFSPTASAAVVPPNVSNLNFSASTQCSQVVVNGGFEDISAWVIPVTEYSAAYTTSESHSGSRSMRTGIVNPADNLASDSTTEQKVTIPAGTTSANFKFWLKSYSGVTGALSLPPKPEAGAPLDSIQLNSDVQYVLILDSNLHIVDTLIWQLSNSRTWTQYQFNLTQYAGKTIWLHFGTTNDGLNGVAAMFVDDVSLDLCSGGSTPTPTPTPGPCTNWLSNPGFESSGYWEIPNTAYPAGYSTELAHSGSRSMRTGILNLANNVYSYSDFRQAVQIPSGSTNVTARFWLYTLSGEAHGMAAPQVIAPTGKPFDQTTLSGDVQYVLVLDQNQNWIATLLWQLKDEGAWHYYEFNLKAYAGSTIYLQFGTFNDGVNGVSNMFVDDVSLDNCSTTPTPTPTPTATPTATPTPTPTQGSCQELVVNNKFDLNTGWTILDTGYPAAYSNVQYHSPFRSMRSGIVSLADNTNSYSDFRQVVSIPFSDHHVTLSAYMYFSSSGLTGQASPEGIVPTGRPFSEITLSDDLQYLLILDQNQNWIDTLVWQRSNTQVWTNMQFDLSGYAGKTIMLQWGVFNNGSGGITSMYVDDVSLQACP